MNPDRYLEGNIYDLLKRSLILSCNSVLLKSLPGFHIQLKFQFSTIKNLRSSSKMYLCLWISGTSKIIIAGGLEGFPSELINKFNYSS